MRTRVDATRAAWCKLGRFWKQRSFRKHKRMAFLGVLHNAAYSGLDAYLLNVITTS